tara:strand:+ start:134 stop:763 length:630 start_codon:yes stop_codon:yes gene_type:complete
MNKNISQVQPKLSRANRTALNDIEASNSLEFPFFAAANRLNFFDEVEKKINSRKEQLRKKIREELIKKLREQEESSNYFREKVDFIATSKKATIEELNKIKSREKIDERNNVESLSKFKQNELLEEIADNIVNKQVEEIGLKEYLDEINKSGEGIHTITSHDHENERKHVKNTRGRKRKHEKKKHGDSHERKHIKRTRETRRTLKNKIT